MHADRRGHFSVLPAVEEDTSSGVPDVPDVSVICIQLKGQARPGQARPGQARPGQARPGQARPGQARPGQARPGQARPGQARPGQARPGQARPGQARPGQARPGQARPGQARPGQARPGQARPGQARPGQARPGQARPGQARPGQARPGQARTYLKMAMLQIQRKSDCLRPPKDQYRLLQTAVRQPPTDKRLPAPFLRPTGRREVFGACSKYLSTTSWSQRRRRNPQKPLVIGRRPSEDYRRPPMRYHNKGLCAVFYVFLTYVKCGTVLRKILQNACLNHPTISCWIRRSLTLS